MAEVHGTYRPIRRKARTAGPVIDAEFRPVAPAWSKGRDPSLVILAQALHARVARGNSRPFPELSLDTQRGRVADAQFLVNALAAHGYAIVKAPGG